MLLPRSPIHPQSSFGRQGVGVGIPIPLVSAAMRLACSVEAFAKSGKTARSGEWGVASSAQADVIAVATQVLVPTRCGEVLAAAGAATKSAVAVAFVVRLAKQALEASRVAKLTTIATVALGVMVMLSLLC